MSRTMLDISFLPEDARRELEDFFLFIKKRYVKRSGKKKIDWKAIVPGKVKSFSPLKREDLYDR
jgi:hypothetical protein